MNSNKVIPVFGAYFNGNFGDDLMGHLIAERLSMAGYEPLLWRGPNYPINAKQWNCSDRIDEFLKDARCVVLGGGMLFCNSNFPEYWEPLSEILNLCEDRRIPIIAVSVGSDGHFENLHPTVNNLINSSVFEAASLRLASDVLLLRSRSTSIDIVQCSDIVLTSSSLHQRKAIKQVLVCLPCRRVERILLRFVFLIMRVFGVTVSSISQFKDDSPIADQYLKIEGRNFPNEGVASILEAVRSCDLLIGRGLHVGMAALSSGAMFVSYRGTGKSAVFLEEFGLSRGIVRSQGLTANPFLAFRLLKIVFGDAMAIDDRKISVSKNAEGHFEFMLKKLASYT